jgi:S-adenosylmethionine hydrolase
VTTHPAAVYFLSDYGTADEFVGVVHAVIHRLAPTVAVIDLSHQIPPFDVAAGASLLERSVTHLGAGVVLAVVDPGVGTGRRGVAVGVAPQAGRPGPVATETVPSPTWMVGPDNGLLTGAAEALGGPVRVVELAADRAGAATTASTTFDGRDVFGPAAAHLALGGDPARLGSDADPRSLEVLPSGGPSPPRQGQVRGRSVVARVEWIDRFGNVQLALRPEDLTGVGVTPGGPARVAVRSAGPGGGGDPVPDAWSPARWVQAFGELRPEELGLITDATGSIALVVDRDSAALRLRIGGLHAAVEVGADEERPR